MRYSPVAAAISALAFGACATTSAYAQESSQSNEKDNTESITIETIEVTSSKRVQSQQDVGLSVAALSGRELRELGIDDAGGVIGVVPGTSITEPNGGGIPVIIIRGVGLQNFRINDTPTTAIYVDEVYQTSVAEAVATIFDVERVEVLKGPQGGLYGRNAVGGAIQIISAKPNFFDYEGYLSVNFEEYDKTESEVVFSGPISDVLAFRVGAKVIDGGGYFRSTTGDFKHGDADRSAWRSMLGYRPSDDVNILFKIHGGEDKSDLPLGRVIGVYQPLGLGLGEALGIPNTADGAILNSSSDTATIDSVCDAVLAGGRDPNNCLTLNGMTPDQLKISSRYDGATLSNPSLNNDWWGASLQADFNVGDLSFTSITAYDDFHYIRYIDQDGLPEIHQEIDYESTIDAWSQEIRLNYDDGGKLRWMLGANYAEDELDEDTLLTTETGLLKATLGGATRASQLYVQSTKAKAAFGRVDWAFADKMNFVLEGRYTEEEKAIDGGTYLPQVGFTLAETDDSTTYYALNGKVALEYSPTKDALLYASFSNGFKSGGYFGGFATNPVQLEPFDKETISAIEVGFKTDWPEQALRLNGAAYYYDRQDVQANGIDTSGLVNIARLTNIGDVEVYGMELDAVWRPISELTIQGGVAWLETEVVESDKATGDLFGTSESETFKGARLPNQPELSGNIIVRYEDNLSESWVGGLQLSYTYRGEQDLGMVLSPEAEQLLNEDAYNLVNLEATIRPDDYSWTFAVYAENLFDEEYRTVAAGGAPGGFQEIYGAPQIFGVRMEYSFY